MIVWHNTPSGKLPDEARVYGRKILIEFDQSAIKPGAKIKIYGEIRHSTGLGTYFLALDDFDGPVAIPKEWPCIRWRYAD